jgi:ribonuclease HII
MNNKRGGKLNELEIEAIVKVLSQEEPEMIIIDSLTASPKKFGDEIKSRLNFDCEIISENKADDTYPLVGAASIVAKELREEEMQQIKDNLKVDVGSGYPSDPKTVKFLKENFHKKEYDFLFRKSWETYKKLVKKETVRKLDEFVDQA